MSNEKMQQNNIDIVSKDIRDFKALLYGHMEFFKGLIELIEVLSEKHIDDFKCNFCKRRIDGIKRNIESITDIKLVDDVYIIKNNYIDLLFFNGMLQTEFRMANDIYQFRTFSIVMSGLMKLVDLLATTIQPYRDNDPDYELAMRFNFLLFKANNLSHHS